MTADADDTGLARERARALIELRRCDEARTALEEVLAVAPADGEAWCLLAQAQCECDDPAAARRSAAAAIAIDPDHEWPHRLLSIAEWALGHHKQAERAAREAVRLDPDSWPPHVQLAQSLNAMRRRSAEAEAAAARAVEIAPNEPATHVVAGYVAANRGDREAAEEAFSRALALDPLDTSAQNALAALKTRVRSPRDLADAASDYAHAAGLDPRAQDSRVGLEHVLRVFLEWMSYLIFLDAYLLGRAIANDARLVVRLIPLALLAIPAAYATRFVAQLTPQLRAHLFRLPLLVGKIRAAAGLELVAVTALVASAAAGHGARMTLAGVAILAAISARIVMLVERRQASRLGKPLFSVRALWVIAALLAALTVASAATAPLFALLCLIATALVVLRIMRARSSA